MPTAPPAELVAGSGAPTALDTLADRAALYVAAGRSAATRRGYACDWRRFEAWAQEHGLQPLPASSETVELYLAHLADAGRRPTTIERALAGISEVHRASGFDGVRGSMRVRLVMRGIKRQLRADPKQARPLLVEDLRQIVRALPNTKRGARDRTLLLLGFAAALRRSELVALDVASLTFVDDGVQIAIGASKTDQERRGELVGVPYGRDPMTCPVRSLRAWIDAGERTEGALFVPLDRAGRVRAPRPRLDGTTRLTPASVCSIVRRAARAAELAEWQAFSGHSMRHGFCTVAAVAGVLERDMMRHARMKSPGTLRIYIHKAGLFVDNPAAALGL